MFSRVRLMMAVLCSVFIFHVVVAMFSAELHCLELHWSFEGN